VVRTCPGEMKSREGGQSSKLPSSTTGTTFALAFCNNTHTRRHH
jgi:hypothetical protein